MSHRFATPHRSHAPHNRSVARHPHAPRATLPLSSSPSAPKEIELP